MSTSRQEHLAEGSLPPHTIHRWRKGRERQLRRFVEGRPVGLLKVGVGSTGHRYRRHKEVEGDRDGEMVRAEGSVGAPPGLQHQAITDQGQVRGGGATSGGNTCRSVLIDDAEGVCGNLVQKRDAPGIGTVVGAGRMPGRVVGVEVPHDHRLPRSRREERSNVRRVGRRAGSGRGDIDIEDLNV